MAVRQYIGARYVPLVYGPWSSGVSYEPLTVVTYLNRSFTSCRAVPADVGAPTEEPYYWIETGAYNAQINAIQENIDAVNARIGQVVSGVRDVVIICDSYGTHNGAGSGHEITYNIEDRLIDYLGWNNDFIHYSAVNGAGFCNGLYKSQLDSLYASAGSWAENVTDLYLIGGWNDESNREGVTQGAFTAAATAFANAARVYFPDVKLHVCFAAWCYQTTRSMSPLRTTLGWYRDLVKDGWIFEENYQYVLHNSSLLIGQNVHPNQDGVDQLAAALSQIILNGECHVSYNVTCGTNYITLPGTLPASSGLTLYQQLRDGVAFVELYTQRGCITLTETASLALDGAHTIELFSYTGPTIVKGETNRVGGACTVSILNNGTRYEVPGYLVIADQSVKFFPDYYPESASYLTLSSISKITIPKTQFGVKAW